MGEEKMSEKLRKIVRINKDNTESIIRLKDLKVGDKFKMYEPTGESLFPENNFLHIEVHELPEKNEKGTWGVIGFPIYINDKINGENR